MANFSRHPFHLVDNSPWPLLSSIFAFGLTVGGVYFFTKFSPFLLALASLGMVLLTLQWWRDVSREATILGLHSGVVELGIR